MFELSSARVGVIGLGYVGLPLALEFGKRYETVGFDLNRARIADLKAGIAHAESVGDFVSRELFADILESEEEHIDWLETQLSLIERIGEANYLQAKLGS